MGKQKEEAVSSNNLLAMALLQKEGLGGAEAKELLNELLKEQFDLREKNKTHQKALAMNRVTAAKEMQQIKEADWKRCNHRKQDNTTRLSGQRLTGTGQICLVCKYCGMDFFHPPIGDQRAVPKDLWPTGDEIGG